MFLNAIAYFWAMSTLVHTEGIVIRTLKYGESSIIAHILTRQLGLQSFIMGGVTSGNSKIGMFQVMNQLDLTVYHQEHKTMHRIKEVRYAKIYQSLPFEMHRTAVGVYMLELLRKCIQGHEIDSPLYDWIKTCLDYSDSPDLSVTWIPIYFTLGLTHHLGFQPLDNHSIDQPYFDLREGRFVAQLPFHRDILDRECSSLLASLIHCAEIQQVIQTSTAGKKERKSLLNGLLDYYRFHLDHFIGLDSPHILEEILAA